MKPLPIFLLALIIGAFARAQDSPAPAPAQPSPFLAGGTPITLPAPVDDMTEVGDALRPIMEIAVPQNNRLLAVFVLKTEMDSMKAGSNQSLTRYAMVEVPRNGEYMDCSPSDFKEVTDAMKQQFGDLVDSSTKEAEQEFNQRLQSMDVTDEKMSLGKPIQLGCFFSKDDEYGFGMITPVTVGTSTSTMAMGAAILRAKQRIIFAYLYCDYKDKSTIIWLQKATEDWADAILKANSSD